MSWGAGFLALALLGQPAPHTYRWRDASGQIQITNTPPPPGAEVLDAPQPPAVEPGRPATRPVPVRQSASQGGRTAVVLQPAQQQAWNAVDQRLARARREGDRRTLEAVADSLVEDCLWGSGLWLMPLLPLVSLALFGLLGWWLALGLRAHLGPLAGGGLVVGALLGHLLLTGLLYRPQAIRLRQNLGLLEAHLGLDRPLRPQAKAQLQASYRALADTATPAAAPWQFPAEVARLRSTLKQVVVDP